MSPIVPDLGVLVSGRGVQSRTDPDHPACLGPGRRPRVTPSPVIVIDDDGMVWPITCPGGDMIVQATLQSLLNVAVFGMTEQQAVEAPRAISLAFPNSFHPHGHHEGMVAVENRVSEATLEGLTSLGHDVREWPPFEFEAGSVGMIRQRLRPRQENEVRYAPGPTPGVQRMPLGDSPWTSAVPHPADHGQNLTTGLGRRRGSGKPMRMCPDHRKGNRAGPVERSHGLTLRPTY